MADTKERILMTALRLFARDGYEAVSVSAIAGELGMTKGALYKHYRIKRDIFDSIVERMVQIDAERSRQYEVPEETYEAAPAAYREVSIENIKEFTLAQFSFWTEDAFASDFRRMLSLEQYRNAEMAELYHQCISAGPVSYMADIFRELTAGGLLRNAEPNQLAVEYYAPMYLLIQLSDGAMDRQEARELLNGHIQRFFQHNAAEE